MPAKGKGKGKAPKNQHQLCEPLPLGEVLTDLIKKEWKLGKSIGAGGFGLIYVADKNSSDSVGEDAKYVVKVEPRDNGPLFSEIAFYQRAAKSDQIDSWKKCSKLPFVGVPPYIAHGLHQHNDKHLRFLVMPRFGTDLHHLWIKAKKQFKRETVAKIALMLIDALEYLHNREYVHADIKGSNVLCDYEDPNKIYLVDYGLAYRYNCDGEHKKYEADPRKAHNGTIEYTSTDAHAGANPSRRGDVEILGLVLLHFLGGTLPWEDKLSDCNYVKEQKIKHLKNVDALVKTSCGKPVPEISQLLKEATTMSYDETPDYNKLRSFFTTALKSMGFSLRSPIDYSNPEAETPLAPPTKKVKVSAKGKKTPKQSPYVLTKKVKTTKMLQSTSNNSDSTLSSDDDQPSPAKKRKIISYQKKTSKQSSDIDAKRTRNPKVSKTTSNTNALSSDDEDSSDAASLARKKRSPHKRSIPVADNENDSPVIRKKSKAATKKAIRLTDTDFEDFVESVVTDKSAIKEQLKSSKTKSGASSRKLKTKRHVPFTSDEEVGDRKKKLSKESSLSTQKKPKPVSDGAKKTSSLKSSSDTPIISAAPKDSKDDVLSDDSDEIPARNSNLLKKRESPQNSRTRSSRHSMAPLHTEPVLTKNDNLTGKYKGKHPVFTRRVKRNVPRSTVSTQTTPSLAKNKSRK